MDARSLVSQSLRPIGGRWSASKSIRRRPRTLSSLPTAPARTCRATWRGTLAWAINLTLFDALDINDAGQILAYGAPYAEPWEPPNPSGYYPLTPVPEPQTWALMGAGLLLIGLVSRRRLL
jgi:hypothetical protein